MNKPKDIPMRHSSAVAFYQLQTRSILNYLKKHGSYPYKDADADLKECLDHIFYEAKDIKVNIDLDDESAMIMIDWCVPVNSEDILKYLEDNNTDKISMIELQKHIIHDSELDDNIEYVPMNIKDIIIKLAKLKKFYLLHKGSKTKYPITKIDFEEKIYPIFVDAQWRSVKELNDKYTFADGSNFMKEK